MGERIWGRTNSRCEVSGRWRMIKMSCDLQHRGFEYKASVNIYIRSLSHRCTALADLPGHWYLFCPHSRRAVLSRPSGTTQPFSYLRLGPQATPEAHLTAGSALWVSTHWRTAQTHTATVTAKWTRQPVSPSALQWVPLCLHGQCIKTTTYTLILKPSIMSRQVRILFQMAKSLMKNQVFFP